VSRRKPIGGSVSVCDELPPTTNHVRVRHVTLFPPSSLPAVVARARSDSLMHGFLCGNASPHYSTLLRARPTLHPSQPRSLLYFCHENGPRPSSPAPATSITESSSASRCKMPGVRCGCVFADYSISPTIDPLISGFPSDEGERNAGDPFFPEHRQSSLSRPIFMDVHCC